jgi:hypothetical protein
MGSLVFPFKVGLQPLQYQPPKTDTARLLKFPGNPLITDKQIRDELMTLMLAGSDTTATTLAFACWELSRHPRIMQQLVEEVEGVVAGREGEFPGEALCGCACEGEKMVVIEITGNRSPSTKRPTQFTNRLPPHKKGPVTADDAAAMPLLGAIINETLRLYSAAPSTRRVATEDCELGWVQRLLFVRVWVRSGKGVQQAVGLLLPLLGIGAPQPPESPMLIHPPPIHDPLHMQQLRHP